MLPVLSPVIVAPVVSPIRLCPCEVSVPVKSGLPGEVFLAMIVLRAFTAPPLLKIPPLTFAEPPLAEFPDSVSLVRVVVPPPL